MGFRGLFRVGAWGLGFRGSLFSFGGSCKALPGFLYSFVRFVWCELGGFMLRVGLGVLIRFNRVLISLTAVLGFYRV